MGGTPQYSAHWLTYSTAGLQCQSLRYFFFGYSKMLLLQPESQRILMADVRLLSPGPAGETVPCTALPIISTSRPDATDSA